MSYDNIPNDLKILPQWVCAWNTSKCPMQAKQRKAASSVDPTTWCDFETAAAAVESGMYDHVGFVFAENGIVGIDIDAGYDEYGFLSSISVDIMNKCRSFTEKSKSGRGIHVYVKGDIPFPGRNNRNGVEIYKASRYFIVTGKTLLFPEIIENQTALDYIVEKYFKVEETAVSEKNNTYCGQRIYSPEYIPPTTGKIALRPQYPPIKPGSRNISLTSLAGQLHTQGYDKAAIYRELLHCNQTACTPPLAEREIQTIVNSVTRYQR